MKRQKGFGIIAVLGGTLVLFVVAIAVYKVAIAPRRELVNEMNSISFPSSYKVVSTNYEAAGLDNDAILKYTYSVSGTREEVFQQVVKSLGLNQDEHKESYDQELHGVGSPKYKYSFF